MRTSPAARLAITAERVSGNRFEVVGSEAGRLVIRDDDGTVVVRERGRVRTTFLFAGPHPLRDADPATVRAAVDELVG